MLNTIAKKKISMPTLGHKLTVDKLSKVLKKLKNNKSPGIDDISAEFFKVFWAQLKFFSRNTINSSYEKGQLSVLLRKSIIVSTGCYPVDTMDFALLRRRHSV